MKAALITIASTLFVSSLAMATIEADVNFLYENFSGNGSGSRIGTYDPAKLTHGNAAAKIYKDLAEVGCYNPSITVVEPQYETQSSLDRTAVSTTKDYFEIVTHQAEVEDEALIKKLKTVVRNLVRDKTNKLVVASIYDYSSDDKVESCSIWRYDIYRADGKLIEIDFNETD